MESEPQQKKAKLDHYRLFNRALTTLYEPDTLRLASTGRVPFDHAVFDRAVKKVFDDKGFTPEMLAAPEVRGLIEETYNALNGAIDTAIKTETPPELTAALQNNAFIFSGFKAYHCLSEVGLELTDSDGHVKSFDTFRKDVEAIDKKYNTNYLYAEYNHAVHTSQMAVKWHDFMADGDRYNLQYRTVGDERVRADHAALDGTTLPPSDDFWKFYLPPNGWNCRCNVVQVLRDDYPTSDPERAMAAGDECTNAPKVRIFRYNAGQEMSIFPRKHPYLPKGCGNCTRNLSLAYDPKREQCRVCQVVSEQARKEASKKFYERLSKDEKYKDVEYDPASGGMKATHIGHNSKSNDAQILRWNMTGADLEKEVQRLLFESGHSVVLCDESKKKGGNVLTALDMLLDGIMMDIRSVTKRKMHYGSHLSAKNKQLIKYNARSDVQIPADSVCLYFHDGSMYHPSKITKGIDWIKKQTRDIAVKNVVCVVRKDGNSVEIFRHKI